MICLGICLIVVSHKVHQCPENSICGFQERKIFAIQLFIFIWEKHFTSIKNSRLISNNGRQMDYRYCLNKIQDIVYTKRKPGVMLQLHLLQTSKWKLQCKFWIWIQFSIAVGVKRFFLKLSTNDTPGNILLYICFDNKQISSLVSPLIWYYNSTCAMDINIKKMPTLFIWYISKDHLPYV